MRFATVVLFVCAIAGPGTAADAVIAIVGVNVVPMDEERVIPGQTVLVRDGRIAEMGPVDDVVVPPEAHVVYGRGRWLMPGLIDMHVHIRSADLRRYVENGVTTVRDLASMNSVVQLARAVERDEIVGPRIVLSSLLFSSPTAQNPPFSVSVTAQSNARQLVDAQIARGASSIKVWADLAPAAYDAVVTAARERGLKVVGHVPQSIDIHHAIVSQSSIEHLTGYPLGNPETNRVMAEASRAAGVWNCPTMTVHTQWVTRNLPAATRERVLEDRRQFVKALRDAGARLLAGTDCGYYVPAGTSMQDEIEELIGAG